jgi:hypothetical protein
MHERRISGDGRFQIAFPGGAGDYTMGFSLVGYPSRPYEIKRTADQDVLVAGARLAAVRMLAWVHQRVHRNGTTLDVGGTSAPCPRPTCRTA